ncbi:MAG: hypothetical protein JST04_04250 [Bdellovibrionales bacterium]|nr:hypothetical protein [Bdellovibrionales bacterium]
METNLTANDPLEAQRYFEAKVRFSTGPEELEHALEHGRRVGLDFALIDVRSPQDFSEGHLPGAINLPEGYWSTLAGLAHDRLNIVYGPTGASRVAARAALEFASAGYPVMELDGGFAAWQSLGFTIDRGVSRFRPGMKTGTPNDSGEPNAGRHAHESLF